MSAAATAIAWTLAVAFSGGTAWSWRRVNERLGAWTKAHGTVTSIKREARTDDSGDHGDRIMYAPVVRFRAGNGDDVDFQDEIWSGGPSHTVGQRVDVLYDPADPQSATLAGWRPYFATLVGGFAAFVMTMIGLIGLAAG